MEGQTPPKNKKLIFYAAIAAAALLVVVGAVWLIPKIKKGAGGGEKTILVVDDAFNPPVVKARYGDVVSWKNQGTKPHTVSFRSLSKTLQPGETWSWTIGPDIFAEGENVYWCDFHRRQGMDGAKLIVD